MRTSGERAIRERDDWLGATGAYLAGSSSATIHETTKYIDTHTVTDRQDTGFYTSNHTIPHAYLL